MEARSRAARAGTPRAGDSGALVACQVNAHKAFGSREPAADDLRKNIIHCTTVAVKARMRVAVAASR